MQPRPVGTGTIVTCQNGVEDADESDTDCGGACPSCEIGKACGDGSDCTSGVCNDQLCSAPGCGDSVQNQDETDTDCGGFVCDGCQVGQQCVQDTDCVSGVCTGLLCLDASCGNGVIDGDETDIDCGNDLCGACPYYISPDGDDGGDGSSASPWKSWSHALQRLAPGDVLLALDGTYSNASGTGALFIDCGAGVADGTEQLPITIRAKNERKALVEWSSGSSSPIQIQNCSYWTIDGLRARNQDDAAHPSGNSGSVVHVVDSDHIVLRRLLATQPDRFTKSRVFQFFSSNRVTLEECEAYDFHFEGIQLWKSSFVTLRRNYFNSRNRADIPGGHVSNPTSRGDQCIESKGANDVIVENNIVQNCNWGIRIRADISATSEEGGDNNLVIGNVVLDAFTGINLESSCSGTNPCTNDNRIVANNLIQDNVTVGTAYGFYYRGGTNNVLREFSSFEHSTAGLRATLSSDNSNLSSDIAMQNVSALGSAENGVWISSQASWSLDSANSYGHTTNYDPVSVQLTNASSLDPEFGGCYVYVPDSSALKLAGASGKDIGANLVFRSKDGQLTSAKLWHPDTGSFPCGSVVPGVNDGSDSCQNAHTTVHVGSAGCPVP